MFAGLLRSVSGLTFIADAVSNEPVSCLGSRIPGVALDRSQMSRSLEPMKDKTALTSVAAPTDDFCSEELRFEKASRSMACFAPIGGAGNLPKTYCPAGSGSVAMASPCSARLLPLGAKAAM